MNPSSAQDSMLLLNDQLLNDLEDFDEELAEDELAEQMAIKEEATDKLDLEKFKDYQTQDLISQEKLKLTESRLYSDVMGYLGVTVARTSQVSQMEEETQQSTIRAEISVFAKVLECNKLITVIDQQVRMIHNFLRFVYAKKFSELDGLVIDPFLYARCVLKLEDSYERKIDVSLEGIISNHLIIAIKMAWTAALSGMRAKELSPVDRTQIHRAAEYLLFLQGEKLKVLEFVETNMSIIAPNTCAVVGRNCAARLIAAAGGLEELSRTPACNIQVMGSQRRGLQGMSRDGSVFHGVFRDLEIYQDAPAEYRTRLVRMLSNNVAKACRVDFQQLRMDGSLGQMLHEQMLTRFNKIQEPTLHQKPKGMRIPMDRPKTRRGGRKYRNMKERLGLTDSRKLQNRLLMDPSNGQIEDEETGYGFGMLGQQNTGVLKVNKKEQKMKLTQKQKQRLAHKMHSGGGLGSNPGMDGMKTVGLATGMMSSLHMGPNQAIELVDPAYIAKMQSQGAQSQYFKNDGFKTVVNQHKHGF